MKFRYSLRSLFLVCITLAILVCFWKNGIDNRGRSLNIDRLPANKASLAKLTKIGYLLTFDPSLVCEVMLTRTSGEEKTIVARHRCVDPKCVLLLQSRFVGADDFGFVCEGQFYFADVPTSEMTGTVFHDGNSIYPGQTVVLQSMDQAIEGEGPIRWTVEITASTKK